MDLNKKINTLEKNIINMQKKSTLENLLLNNNTNNTNNINNTNNTNNEVNIDEEIYKSMPPIVRMNAFNNSDTI